MADIKAQIVLGGKLDGSLMKAMSAAQKRMGVLNKSMGGFRKAGATAAKAVGVAVAAATAATAKVVKDSVAAGREFDTSMSQVAATMGKSVDDIGNLREFAIQMGEATKFSAKEAADALNYMALAGYDADTSMKMLPNVLNLAAAGGMELAEASDMVTDTQSALGLSIEQTSKMVDQMAKAASTTNTSVAQLGEAMLTVGGTAKSMKGGTVEISQALGLLADNGVKGAEGGTALRNILLGLSSDKFEKTFGALGVSAYDTEGNMRSLQDVFADMNSAMADMTVEEQTKALSSAFNKVDLKSLNALLGTDAKRWEQVSSAIADSAGAAQKMADTQLDNLEGDLTLFDSALYTTKIRISDALTPAMRDFVQFGTDGLGELNKVLAEPAFRHWADDAAKSFTGAAKEAHAFMFGTAAVIDEDTKTVIRPAMKGIVSEAHDFLFGVGAVIDQDTQTVITPKVAGMFDGLFENIDYAGFEDAILGLGDAVGTALGDGSPASSAKDFGSMLADGVNLAIPVIQMATPIIAGIAGAVKFLADNGTVVVPIIAGIAGGFMVIQGVSAVAGVVTTVAGALGVIGTTGAAAAGGLTATAAGERAAGSAATASAAQIAAVGGAVLMIGGGVALAALGLGILAQSAIAVAGAGPGAAAALAAMVGALFAIGAGAYFAGPALTAGAVGMLAFGAATLMIGAGIAVASAGLTLLAGQLPIIATYGMMAGPAMIMIGAGLLTMGAGAAIAGAGLLVAAPGLVAFSAAAIPGAAAMTGLAGAVALLAGPISEVGGGMASMGAGMSEVARYGGQGASAMALFGASAAAAAPAVASAAPSFATLGVAAQASSLGLSASAAAFAAIVASAAALSGLVMLLGVGFVLMSGNAQAMAGSLAVLSGATGPVIGAFSGLASSLSGSMSRAAGAVSSGVSAIQSAVSGMSLTLPPIHGSVPVFSSSGSFNAKTGAVPTINVGYRYFARGGFTDGPIAIAGEAGTEAVISFDPRYHDANVGYWMMAGQMLGVVQPFAEGGFTDGFASPIAIDLASPDGYLATAAGKSSGPSGGSVNLGGVTFAPQITVTGASRQDVLEQLRAAEDDFRDMIEEIMADLERDYAPVL